VLVELTVALFSSDQDEPLFTEMYGVIAVGVQPMIRRRLHSSARGYGCRLPSWC
jgi:hypothetical protein